MCPKQKKVHCGLGILGAALLGSWVFPASSSAQTPQVVPQLTLSVNNDVAPAVSQGWPLVFELEVYHPDVAQRNGNVVPVTLNLPTGSWADGIRIVVLDNAGNMQTWPVNLVFRPTGTESSILLDAGVEGRLAWTVTPDATLNIAPGTYEVDAFLDATSATATGAFNGTTASNPVKVTIGPEPSPLSTSQQEGKYALLATYDLLQGNQTQAVTDLNTLLTNLPNSITAMTLMGDLLNLQGQTLKALQSYDQAVAAFAAAYPTAPEPPSGLISRQSALRSSLISQSGIIKSPQVAVSLAGQGVQSAGILYFDFQLTNSGTGWAKVPAITQLSYLTTSGTGQERIRSRTLRRPQRGGKNCACRDRPCRGRAHAA
jgi:hypothetical protein